MRYERKVAALSIALGVLLAIWALGMILDPGKGAARSESVKLMEGKIEQAAEIELTTPDSDPIRLVKSGESWNLADGDARLPVQSSRVKNLLESLAKPGTLKAAGRSKAAWADFGLEEGKAKRARVSDQNGKQIADVFVGGYSSTGSGVYLRTALSERSYLAESSIASYLGYGRSSWLDLQVLGGGAATTDVQSVALRAKIALDGEGKAPTVLDYEAKRDGESWKIGAAQADAQAIESMLRSALSVRGEDIVATPPAGAFSPVSARVELVLSSGVSKVIEIGVPAGGERFYLRAAGNPLVYLVSAYTVRSILKSPAELALKK